MKKLFSILNIITFLASVSVTVIYYFFYGGTFMKGITSFMFVIVGLVNLIYAFINKIEGKAFVILMNVALVICMVADVILSINFMIGALVFALGHVVYFISYCKLQKFNLKDLIPIALMFVISLIFLMLPIYDYGSDIMFFVIVFYGLIISCMVGKAAGSLLKNKCRVNIMILIGSIMFYLSDLMLLVSIFADAPEIANFLCCFFYWPGQTLLAHTLFHYTENKIKQRA